MPDLGLQAPRLSDPSKRSTDGFYTPYFQTFTFEGMLEAGEADFVLGQYKAAWGWAMQQSSTWVEVFDPRWEATHSWGGCPTWQLSRYGNFDIIFGPFLAHSQLRPAPYCPSVRVP